MRAVNYLLVGALALTSMAFQRAGDARPSHPTLPHDAAVGRGRTVAPYLALAARPSPATSSASSPAPGDVRALDAAPRRAAHIALQAGHWRADEAPRELSGLKDNGTSWQGKPEWQVNLAIAERAASILRDLGYEVDVLPAVVPPRYRADLFIAIHADGSNDPAAAGYRVASPRRDRTGRARLVAALLEEAYGRTTGLTRLATTTRRMRNYYAFNYRRYQHSLDPATPGVIIETGFLTSSHDRRVIVDQPDLAARGIVAAVMAYPETRPPDGLDR